MGSATGGGDNAEEIDDVISRQQRSGHTAILARTVIPCQWQFAASRYADSVDRNVPVLHT